MSFLMWNARPLWPLVGLILSITILAVTASDADGDTAALAAAASFVALCLHQVEEYTLPGGFTDFYNTYIQGRSPMTRVPLGRWGTSIVNIGLGWTLYGWCATGLAPTVLIAGLALFLLLNAGAHLGMAVTLRQSNPGVVTGALVMIPCGVWVLTSHAPAMSLWEWAGAIVFLPVAVVAIQVSIRLGRQFETK